MIRTVEDALECLYRDIGIDERDADVYRGCLDIIKRWKRKSALTEIELRETIIEQLQRDREMDVFLKAHLIEGHRESIDSLKKILL